MALRVKSGVEIFRHRGCKVVCAWTRPIATTPRFPAVLFLHGFPGSEKNVDVQRALLKRGVAGLTLHFRGAWGSEGTYRFSQLVDDARAGLRFLRRLPGVDPRRLGVFGFSFGGWTAVHLAAREPAVRAVAAVAPMGGAELLRPGPEQRRHIGWLARALKTDGLDALLEDFGATLRRSDVYRSAARLRRPLLLVHGKRDEIVPYGVSQRLRRIAGGQTRLVLLDDAFHDFLEQRERLTRLTAGWLAERLGA